MCGLPAFTEIIFLFGNAAVEPFCYENLKNMHDMAVTVTDSYGNQERLIIMEVFRGELRGENWDTFGVIWRGESNLRMRQGTYTISHPSFGDKFLFLLPRNETEYETVVARRCSTH